MEYRRFGNTSLEVSVVKFWRLGMRKKWRCDMPIGWGDVTDKQSVRALERL